MYRVLEVDTLLFALQQPSKTAFNLFESFIMCREHVNLQVFKRTSKRIYLLTFKN